MCRAALVALILVLAPGAAGAVTLDWLSAVTGNAGTASRWNPAQVPQAGDVVRFAVGGSYTVTFDGTVPVNTTQIHRSGTVTLLMSNHTVSGTFRVGDSAGDVATARLTTGDLATGSNVTLGNASTAQGTLEVDDDDANLVQTGATADIVVGSAGQGTLRVTGGGFVDAADDVVAGSASGSQGTIVVSGVNAAPLVRSGLFSSGADGDLVFGNNGGATVSIAAGAQAVAADDVRIAVGSASVATVTVDGASTPFAAELRAFGDLDVAQNGIAGASGTGTLVVQNQGSVVVDGATRLGDADGGTGTLRLRANSFLSAHDLLVDPAHGVLDWQGGTISVHGGVFDPPGTAFILDHPQFESLRLTDGATATFDGGSSAAYSLILGETNSGGLRLESGARLTHPRGVLAIGLAPGSNGTLDLTGSSTLLEDAGTIVVGQGGFGELGLSDGADLTLTEMAVAHSPGSNGFVSLAGNSASLSLSRLFIGGSASAAGGTASVNVGNASAIEIVAGANQSVRIHPGGTLTIAAGGLVHGANNLDLRGRIVLSGGRLEVGSLNLFLDNGVLEGAGVVAGAVAASSATSAIRATGGNLQLGTVASDKGFSNSGTLTVGSNVFLLDADASNLGNVVLAGGSLAVPAGGGIVQAGCTLSGVGTVGGNLTFAGTLAPGSSAGQVTVGGSVTIVNGGRLTMEIGDAASAQHDRLQVSGSLALTGTLDIRRLPGFVPAPGEEFTLITCASRSGTFAAVTFEGQPVNGQFTILYQPTSVVLRVNGLTTAVPAVEAPPTLSFVGRAGSAAQARFELALPEDAHVVVRVYDSAGRALGTLLDGDRAAGVVTLPLRGLKRKLSGGVYFGRLVVRVGDRQTIRTSRVALVP